MIYELGILCSLRRVRKIKNEDARVGLKSMLSSCFSMYCNHSVVNIFLLGSSANSSCSNPDTPQ